MLFIAYEFPQKYEFKHEDLIRKRDKISEQARVMDKNEQNQSRTLQTTRKLEQQQRARFKNSEVKEQTTAQLRALANEQANPSSSKTIESKEQDKEDQLLLRDLQALDGHSSLSLLSKILEQKAISVAAETKVIQAEIARMGCLLEKYKIEKRYNEGEQPKVLGNFT